MTEVEQFIADLPDAWHQAACTTLLDVTRRAGPGLEGLIKWSNPYFSIDGRAAVKWHVARDWISVRLYRGAFLDDPHGLFEPDDNASMRTVKLRRGAQIPEAALERLLRECVTEVAR